MENYSIDGTIYTKGEPQVFTPTFTKQTFVLHQDGQYPQYIEFSLVNTRIAQIHKAEVGDKVRVLFNIKGQKYTNKTTHEEGINTSLQAYQIEKV